jgi:hypothetical protein
LSFERSASAPLSFERSACAQSICAQSTSASSNCARKNCARNRALSFAALDLNCWRSFGWLICEQLETSHSSR